MIKRLADKEGEVRELTDEDVKQMRPMGDVLPMEFQRTIRQGISVTTASPYQSGNHHAVIA
ncbi:hypothetical protein [Modicisalibacter xianhensis]|uniref:Uncharacterized protein n=1 Tax=Modicisalibacter xianhensis TaxID=442341 RepID=A0A1I3B0A9_9GAMM|nr:hypothetical protein [Halomonas xianhensis]SFH55755.1 hypothetical protein SAMN04487959_105280 [Halomonas xianhensis]